MSKITVLGHLKALAERAKAFANDLVGEILQTVTEAITELHSVKADKGSSVAFTIPTTGWGNSGNASYPKYYDISAIGVTAKDRVEITIAPGSMDTAGACGLCPTCQTIAGKIRVLAAAVPTAGIAVEYWVENGKE